jgi:glycosyltransferase involved in cell wall biosynthesis
MRCGRPLRENTMQAENTISVIITNYNYERYVGGAIDSVLAQTRPADEIIVIDDGSTDRSRERIVSYGDKVQAVFQENQGIKAISNTGYRIAKGSLVLYLDADDLLYPNALELVEQAYKPGTSKVQFDLDVIDEIGNSAERRFCNFSEAMSAEDTARAFAATGTYLWPVTSGNAYAREFLSRVMPFTPPESHDGVLNTIAPLYGRVATIAQPLGQYRIHSRNISRSTGSRSANIPHFARRIGIRKQEFDILQQHAAKLGVRLPDGDLLDNELVFTNYRLMARKLNDEHGNDRQRPLWDLWLTGVSCVFRDPITFPARMKHLIWITCLASAPRQLARHMISLRFNRTQMRAGYHAPVQTASPEA